MRYSMNSLLHVVVLFILIILMTLVGYSFANNSMTSYDVVEYRGFDGFNSIAYEAKFLGYNSGINRSFTNYARSFNVLTRADIGWDNGQIVLADFNGNGFDDIAQFDPNSGVLSLKSGKEVGSFSISVSQRIDLGITEGRFLAGDFNGNGSTDIAIANPEESQDIIVLFNDGDGSFNDRVRSHLGVNNQNIVTGDFNGNRIFDLCVYDPYKGGVKVLFGDGDGTFSSIVESELPESIKGGQIVAADFNQDLRWDIALYDTESAPGRVIFLMGRGDGSFGPRDDEIGTLAEPNLMVTFRSDAHLSDSEYQVLAGHIHNEGIANIGFYNFQSEMLILFKQSGTPAYNYAVNLIKDGDIYRMHYGGRWAPLPAAERRGFMYEGDHIMRAYSEDGRTWFRKIDGPVMHLGLNEKGVTPRTVDEELEWWMANTMDPHVVKVDDVYYMYFQVQINPGERVDTGQIAQLSGDRIGVAISTDGNTWNRKIDRGVIIDIDEVIAGRIAFTHPEVIYVPDDEDGKPWWLYVNHFMQGHHRGFVRIRSNTPTEFRWRDRESVTGMAHIGNQIAYADEAPGGRVFIRITFIENEAGRTVPTFQISRDALRWHGYGRGPYLPQSDNDSTNSNMYFLGISTIDGTGKLDYLGDGKFHAIYGATTSETSVAPEIFNAKIGIGEVIITFKE